MRLLAKFGTSHCAVGVQPAVSGCPSSVRLVPGFRWLLCVAIVCFLAFNSPAQKASNWRVYRLADGLPESGCISVTFSQRKVLVRHLSLPFVTELDGYTNTVIPAPELGKSRVYQSPGGQLWTVFPGGIQEFRQGAWMMHPLSAISRRQEPGAKVIDPVPLQPVRQGIVIFLQPDGLMLFNADKGENPEVLKAAGETGIGRFFGMAPAKDGGLWISGERGFARVSGPLRAISPASQWQTYQVPPDLELLNLQSPQEDRPRTASTDTSFFVMALAETRTNGAKAVVCFDGEKWQTLRAADFRLRHAWRGPEKSYWGMAIDSVFQWEEMPSLQVKAVEEIYARQYFDVAVEPGGAFWLATSDGLYRYAALLWSSHKALAQIVSPVSCIGQDHEGRLCFVTGNRLHVFHEGKLAEYGLPASAARLQARAMFPPGEDLILAMQDPEAPGPDQLFKLDAARGQAVSVDTGGTKLLALGTLADGSLCLENVATGELQTYKGQRLSRFSPGLDLSAFGTKLNTVFSAQNGDLWLGGDQGVALLREGAWRFFNPAERLAPEEGLHFIELADGRIWVASSDQVWEFDGRNWTSVRRDLDRVNGMVRTRDGAIWVASNNGAHRYFRGAWVEHGLEEGLPSASVRAMQETPMGLWLATARGLTLFHPEADPEPDAPRTWITKLTGDNKSTGDGGPVTISFSGQDKWKHTPRERLLYSYRLDEQEWSAFEDKDHVSFPDLGAGKHYFKVRAMDRNSNIDPKPAQLEFSIVLPWYRETRLLLIALAGFAGAIFFAALALNRHLQLARSYAEVERKVAERTRQLEVANRELLHSQKMNALGALAAGIAHDFNNILSIIKGSAQIIEDNLADPGKIQTRTNRIKTVVEQGAGIVRAMLGFSRESGPQPEVCSINSVVEDTLTLLGDRFLREVQVKFDRGCELPAISVARDFVQQILLNFIFNGAESMRDRKEIIVSTRQMEQLPAEMVLVPKPAANYVSISVSDFGCGIRPENLSRIFEPFFTTKAFSARRGTGLGLSMVYELARKLDAGLAVHSVQNEGSTFMLILPVSEVPPPAATGAQEQNVSSARL